LAELATLQMFWEIEQGVGKMMRISETSKKLYQKKFDKCKKIFALLTW
jgi:hypothetical protein